MKSLGYYFTDGYQRHILLEVLTGLVLTMALALVIDALLVLLGRLAMPWARTTPLAGAPHPRWRCRRSETAAA